MANPIRWSAILFLLPVAIAAQSRRPSPAPTIEPQQSGTTARLQAVWAVSDEIVWASGTRGTFTRTTDGGKTWRAGVVPGADSLEFRDVHAFDASHAVLLAAGPGDKSRLYHTADGGRSWKLTFTNRDPARFYDCIDFQGRTGYAVSDAVNGRFPLLRTRNGGESWEEWSPSGSTVPAAEGEGAFAASGTCLTVHPDGSVWIGTAGGGRTVRFAAEGSTSFPTPVVKGNAAGIASIAFRDRQTGIAAGGDLGRAADFMDNVAVTTDGGRSWALGGRPPFSGSVYGLAYVRSLPLTVVAVGPKGAAWSSDNGKTWSLLDSADYWGIGFGRGNVGWIAGPDGRIAKVVFDRGASR